MVYVSWGDNAIKLDDENLRAQLQLAVSHELMGEDFMAIDKNIALAIYPIIVMIVGTMTVNPLEYFIEHAQVTSNIPAKININHRIIYVPP